MSIIHKNNHMTKLIFIHGFKSFDSKKFKVIQKTYPNAEQFEWFQEQDITHRLRQLAEKLSQQSEDIVIIGDSAGGNFACQLREMMNEYPKWCKLFLINPLLRIEDVKIELSEKLKCQLKQISRVNEAVLLLSIHDDVVDNSKVVESTSEFCQIEYVHDTHAIKDFSKYMTILTEYINQIWM